MKNPKRHAPAPIIDNLASVKRDLRPGASLETRFTEHEFDAAADYVWAIRFLVSYDGSNATFNAYRRELERLLQWSWLIQRQSLLSLHRDDIVDFIQFITKPPIIWIGTKNAPRFVHKEGQRVNNPAWRPFIVSAPKSEKKDREKLEKNKYSPSQAAIRATFAVLSSFFDYLVQESVVAANPVALIRQKSKYIRKQSNIAPVRRVSNLQWDYVIETAEIMADEDPARHERTLFIMSALFAMYLRISELVADERSNPTMGDFKKDRDGNWWFHVTGKGNKDRTVTVSNEMLSSLKRYRSFRELSPLPSLNEKTPLIPKVRGHGPVTSTRMIRVIVQECFDRSYKRMKADGLEEDALDLKEATVHWLRHTGISEDIQTRPREHVRDDAGHASMATTDRYIESDLRERHASGKRKRIKDL